MQARLITTILGLSVHTHILHTLLRTRFLVLPRDTSIYRNTNIYDVLLRVHLRGLRSVLFVLVSRHGVGTIIRSIFLTHLCGTPSHGSGHIQVFILYPIRRLATLPIYGINCNANVCGVGIHVKVGECGFVSPVLWLLLRGLRLVHVRFTAWVVWYGAFRVVLRRFYCI